MLDIVDVLHRWCLSQIVGTRVLQAFCMFAKLCSIQGLVSSSITENNYVNETLLPSYAQGGTLRVLYYRFCTKLDFSLGDL